MEDKLNKLRKEIDDIDSQIINLITNRINRVSQVAEIKTKYLTNIGNFIMPAREDNMLKSLCESNPNIDKDLIQYIWRGIIAFSLNSEKNFNINKVEGCQINQLNQYFPYFIPQKTFKSIKELINLTQDADINAIEYKDVIANYDKIKKQDLLGFKKFEKEKIILFSKTKIEFLKKENLLFVATNKFENKNYKIKTLYKEENIILAETNDINLINHFNSSEENLTTLGFY